MKKSILTTLVAGLLVASNVVNASITTFSFSKITSNGNPDISSQLTAQIFETTPGFFALKFYNDVNSTGIDASISEIYIDDGILGPAAITDSDGAGNAVSYIISPVNPGDLPGGNSISPVFNATLGLSADRGSGNPSGGVDATGEWVQLQYGFGSYTDFNAVLNAFNTGDIRIGIHAVSIGDNQGAGGSDSFVNLPAGGGAPVPEPSTYAMFGTAFAILGFVGYRSRSRRS